MKKASPDHPAYTDRIRSWARTKAHGNSPLAASPSRNPTLPLTNPPGNTTAQQNTRTPSDSNNATSNLPPFASADTPGIRGQPSNTTANNEADNISNVSPPPAPPPQDEGEGSVVENEKPPKKNVAVRFYHTGKNIIFSSYFNVLLVFVPVGIAAKAAGLNPTIIFAMNAIAIIPLAGLLAHATESVAKRMGDTVGALMNVTFGNAVELIIFIIALVKNEIRIVQASLLGSILANLLLILGMSFLIGGLRFREQIYNSTVTQMSACLLSLSVTSLLLPTAFHASFTDASKADFAVLQVSRGTSVILLLVYGMYLLFQLKSHAYMYESTPQHIIDEESAPGPVAAWMDTSSSDGDGSSSSDSDGSSGSNTTAKRFGRLMRAGRRRRKSSLGSKDTADLAEAGRTPSFGTGSINPTRSGSVVEEPTSPGFGHRLGAIDLDSHADDEADRDHLGKHTDNKRKSKKDRKHKRKRHGKDEEEALNEKDSNDTSVQKHPQGPNEPRRVDFAVANDIEAQVSESEPKKSFNIRTLRPAIPKTFSQNIFTQPVGSGSPHLGASPAPAHQGPIPRVRYGIRRTNSLPDRLNQTYLGTAATTGPPPAAVVTPSTTLSRAKDDDEENISRTTAVCLLLISTGLVAICAEFMVDSIDAVTTNTALGQTFVGLIILPIVGNAAEHVTAVTVATKNKMDLAIGVAVGSSIQIALFVTPFVVILGWCMSKDMSLYFTLFETVALFVSVFVVNFLVLDGRSNYLEGALLCAAYVIIAVAAYFYPDTNDESVLGGNDGAASKMIRSLLGI